MTHTEPEVPMELVGVQLEQGSINQMTRCLIEEYMLLGWNERQLLMLFKRPNFRTTHQIYKDKGEEYVKSLIQQIGDEWHHGYEQEGNSDA